MLSYTFMRTALIISVFISILCPSIGIYLVLRRYSMIGDTLAHSSLAGIAIGLSLGQNPILSAFIFTSIAGVFIEFLRDYYKRYAELILSIVLSLSVGIAITLVSSGKASGNINSFLFGSILTVSKGELLTVFILSIISCLTLLLLHSELLYIAFDEEGAKIANVRVKLINYIFSILVAATISVSIRIVGVLVLSSLIALPVATALQFKKGFKNTLFLSILISIFDVISALFLSYYLDCAPGGITALISVFILLIVMVFKRNK
ncbi:metal ABC transporter permease [Clostridium botulinum]|uniref:Putative metal ion ABC transporter, permease protein n=1 Tax=Clostridium botulinum (strain Okra / Type B1) TaxID=498213 RepID=B1IK95_CLOBK|nr:metal ABC transporter permease [Clostridium botulinum]EKX80105.1 manganese/zinc/iron chelate ABC transporter permease [Clostridium botulinum CFSAN001628]ACA43571.1 putative metal ion ABC transporter, permease protein [Clostridium botulinum B1 str. Okra]MBD5563306.1 metal ABC transporter permease [Clostridium botulinum]MBD5565880.1 metal ABC transporter permease [Clostridium botulinum]MBD5569602.1 metal ABC transporter permease [Clostridium botulinum]